jgi:1-acyl-sn-glycerol-3-phosphate acyltransferase
MGWSPFADKYIQRIQKYPRTVVVFSHSSRFDFLFLLLFRAAHPYALYHLRALVKPQLFKYAGWFLNLVGCIPSTRIEDREGGAVNRIVRELRSSPQSIFAISPKGTTNRNEWRSGYYHIAQQLKAPLIACGSDYETKQAYFSKSIDYNLPEEEVRQKLQSKLSKVVPLYPECEIMPIREHDPSRRSLIDFKRLFLVIIAMISVAKVTSSMILLSLVA